jgi:hypothetical protein
MWTPADRANWAPSFRSLRYQIVRTRMATVSADLISKATAGDEEAFHRLVDPY